MKPSASDRLLELADRPDGVAYKDLPEYSANNVRIHAQRLVKEGKLIRAAANLLTVRYFLSQSAADAWVRSRQDPAKARTRATWTPDTPPYLPTDSAGKPLWRLTVAPTPPAATRTNTYSQW